MLSISKTDDDVEVLVHMGIDTVELDGAPFNVMVAEETRLVLVPKSPQLI